jgi:DNA invertase Pin-like site-specific DNA recombinase
MMMTNRNLTLVPYGRTSREKGRSKEQQERDYRSLVAREYDGRANVRLLEWCFDHGTTGGKFAGRQQLRAALELIAAGQADGVVVPEAKRFGRNTRESLNLIHALREGGAVQFGADTLTLPGGGLFFALDVPGAEDPDNPDAKLALTIWLGIAERELDGFKIQWNARKRRWAEAGGYIGAAPLGYRTKRDARADDVPRLEPDPETADAVREAFRLAITNGVAAAARHLGLPPSKLAPTPDGNPKRGQGLLRNPVYLGRTTWRDDRRGDVVIVKDAHEPLVDRATFWRVQKVLADAGPVSRRRPSERYPLSRVPTCARCDTPLVGSMSLGRRMYRCGSNSGTQGAVRCGPFANLLAGDLEDHVRALLVEHAQAYEDEQAARADASYRPPAGEDPYAVALEPQGTDAGPARAALEAAERDLQQTLAAHLPVVVKAAAIDAAERALAEAQEALEAVLADTQEPPWLEPWEIAQATAAELPGIVQSARVRFVVSPERGTVAERVRLVPNGDEQDEPPEDR